MRNRLYNYFYKKTHFFIIIGCNWEISGKSITIMVVIRVYILIVLYNRLHI